MKKFSKFLLISIFLIFTCETNAQDITPKKEVKIEGWTIPAISESKKLNSKGTFPFNLPTNSNPLKEEILIDLQMFELKKRVRTEHQVDLFNKEKDVTRYSEIRFFMTYSVKGKIFAYKVQTEGLTCTKTKDFEVCGYLGCASDAFYVDEDGDGKYEVRYLQNLPLVPDWIKK